MTRAEFSKAVRRDAFARANGRCEWNGEKLFPGSVEYHHTREAYLGGEPTMDNCLVLCTKCHAAITKSRRPEIDKTRRIADKAMGIKRKSRPMPGGRDSKWKKKISGEVVFR